AAYLTGRSFFPALISPAFTNGLHIAFDFAIAACLIAAIASLLRGSRYVHEEHAVVADAQPAAGSRPAEEPREAGTRPAEEPREAGSAAQAAETA
ncbi:MAG: hypothetical protein ACRDNZ_14635, partial [Streptosporangiaceae bacterium]